MEQSFLLEHVETGSRKYQLLTLIVFLCVSRLVPSLKEIGLCLFPQHPNTQILLRQILTAGSLPEQFRYVSRVSISSLTIGPTARTVVGIQWINTCKVL